MSIKVVIPDSTDHFVNVLSLLPCTSKTGGKKLFIMTDTDETKYCYMMNGMIAANIQKAGEIIVSPKFLFPCKITITPRPLLLYLNTLKKGEEAIEAMEKQV